MKLWIDALSFTDYGDWKAETQFVREMGQGYLMALKTPGCPAADCMTAFEAPKPGMYRFWVRTKNWIKDYAPGKFYALVDGARIGNEMGNLPGYQWAWQTAGDIELTEGAHTLAMNDTTGYFPRFAAVMVTDDMDYTPSPEWERISRERAGLLGQSGEPECEREFDVVVTGAGPGGIPAAIAAAREGCRTALINSRPVLGGNASDEARVGFDGSYISHPGMRESGIAEEIRRLRDSGCTWQRALEILCERTDNLTVFLNQCVTDAELSGDGARITAAVAQNTLDGTRRVFPGKMFIDASGDGWLGYYAGAAYRVGREAKWQTGEQKAPRLADSRTMSGCLMSTYGENQVLSFYAEDTGAPFPFCAPDWAQILPKKLYRDPRYVDTGDWWLETPTDYDDLFEAESVRDELMIISLGYFHWLKNDYEKRDLARNYRITAFPAYNAKRESRRLIGDYVLTQEDCETGRPFPDAVAYAGWSIDVHNQDGIFSGLGGPYDFDIHVPLNQIPYRSLYSKNVENLLMAGRCISVSHIALGTVRVENTLSTTGQAAGTAAALALRKGITPRALGQGHIKELQQILLRNDQFIPGLRNEDPADLARMARITATSQSASEKFGFNRGIEGDWQVLDETYCMIFPYKLDGGVKTCLEIYLRNQGPDTVLNAAWVEMDDFDVHDIVEQTTVYIPAGFAGYLSVSRSKALSGRISGIHLLENQNLRVRKLEFADHGYYLAVHRPPYWSAARNQTFIHRFADDRMPPLAYTSPLNVINGVARPISRQDYAWVSDPDQEFPQDITLEFGSEISISMIQAVFDTDLCNPLYSAQSVPIVRQLVKDYDVLADGNAILQVRDNNARFRRHSLLDGTGKAIKASSLTVRVLATYGDPSARIFEIRVY